MKGMRKSQHQQGVTKKSEIDHLFSRLYPLYAPSIVSPLTFPALQVAQARAWRGHPGPIAPRLSALSRKLQKLGFEWVDLSALIACSEALFRPTMAVELALGYL